MRFIRVLRVARVVRMIRILNIEDGKTLEVTERHEESQMLRYVMLCYQGRQAGQ
jgi:hypothetical protein